MKTEIAIVQDLMSKYNLTKKDLFSFCICAVNFFEYYYEECMGDVMRNCPERYYSADSDNVRAAAGALKGEQKAEGWTEEDQFAHYMEAIQDAVVSEFEDDCELTYHFVEELQRFEKVYKREIMIPIILGCPVEAYDDSKFSDEKYLASLADVKNLVLYNAHEEEAAARLKQYQEEEAAKLATEVEERKNDKDFSVLLSCCVEISRMKKYFEEYNRKFYPGRELKVAILNPFEMIVQTAGKSIEDVQKRLLDTVKYSNIIIGCQPEEKLITLDQSFKVRPKWMDDYKVGYMVTYL